MSGTIITWILALIIFLAFALVLKKIYHNFTSGGGCCGPKEGGGGCSGGCCGCGTQEHENKEHSISKH